MAKFGPEKKKYYITRGCVFSSLKKAKEHAMRLERFDDTYDTIFITYLDETNYLKEGIIDSYTGEIDFFSNCCFD